MCLNSFIEHVFPRFIQTVACVSTSFFLRLTNIPLCGWTTFCLYICPVMDIWVVLDSWVVSTFWLVVNSPAVNNHGKFSHEQEGFQFFGAFT